jgi:hypothetical protein
VRRNKHVSSLGRSLHADGVAVSLIAIVRLRFNPFKIKRPSSLVDVEIDFGKAAQKAIYEKFGAALQVVGHTRREDLLARL